MRKAEQVRDPLVADELEEPRVPGDHPAVEPKRRRKQRGRVHLGRVLGGEHHGQHRSGREPAGNDDVAVLLDVVERQLGAAVPVGP